jgi:hypothetical protein
MNIQASCRGKLEFIHTRQVLEWNDYLFAPLANLKYELASLTSVLRDAQTVYFLNKVVGYICSLFSDPT